MVGLNRGTVRWDDPRQMAPPAHAWGASSAGGSGAATPNAASGGEMDGEVEGVKAKGKKAKKEVLYKFG